MLTSRFDEIQTAIEQTRRDLAECTERMTQAEVRLSTVEDEQTGLSSVIKNLERRSKTLEVKLTDMETRSWLNNVRLVNLPEGAEGPDPCSFLENSIPLGVPPGLAPPRSRSWITLPLQLLGVQDLAPLRCPIVMEKAHRIGPIKDARAPPRTLIMKLLNYQDKLHIMRAAGEKKDILYKNQQVRFYNDLATEVHKQRTQYDSVRQQLRSLGLRRNASSQDVGDIQRANTHIQPADGGTALHKQDPR